MTHEVSRAVRRVAETIAISGGYSEATALRTAADELDRLHAIERAAIEDYLDGREAVDEALASFGYDDLRFADVRHGWICSTRWLRELVGTPTICKWEEERQAAAKEQRND